MNHPVSASESEQLNRVLVMQKTVLTEVRYYLMAADCPPDKLLEFYEAYCWTVDNLDESFWTVRDRHLDEWLFHIIRHYREEAGRPAAATPQPDSTQASDAFIGLANKIEI